MYVKLRDNRIKIRLIILLAVQTVCLIAGPAQAKIIQTCSIIPVCAQAETDRTVQTGVFAKHSIRPRRPFPLPLACAACAGIAATPLLLPAIQTPVRRRVRLND